ncbi:MAG: methylenetetrahydrofolate--tRNA-(uracil(54)-C(5))-methyltransferase (FADH(2)-oxidizing) TrmFO [Christensenellaceae bacterium]|nr:methylenetetrahydrofolate--tRNA-(uracil(54)-C(5))-methyltransferase (FADH(2)-oxidizing) TrmFO [Christensenellaceae bacterium]
MKTDRVAVIGAGLAGCEAAWQLAKRGIKVRLYEMKPQKYSPVHHHAGFAELVCSNSLRADRLSNAVGLLKEEMRLADSLIMRAADASRVPAGGALAVDRVLFSDAITKTLSEHPLVEVVEGEVEGLTHEAFSHPLTIVATGPLTSDTLAGEIAALIGVETLHFFDAAAPIVTKESINFDRAFYGSRYGKGGDDYVNCPMDREEYQAFYDALISAECAEIKEFEKDGVFEGCMPVEVMAKRGFETLLYGPLKPVGLNDPVTGKRHFAVVQLRKEDNEGTLFNLVGFQTHLKFPEQKRVFGMIPALKNAEFTRYGVMHRNTYMDSPKLLDRWYRFKNRQNMFFAGQMTGVEGYVESAASGLLAGISAARIMQGKALPEFSARTALGALANYVSTCASSDFQPMNITFGIMEPLEPRIRKKEERNEKIAQRALEEVRSVLAGLCEE